jgi:hypothetical protein
MGDFLQDMFLEAGIMSNIGAKLSFIDQALITASF